MKRCNDRANRRANSIGMCVACRAFPIATKRSASSKTCRLNATSLSLLRRRRGAPALYLAPVKAQCRYRCPTWRTVNRALSA